MIEIKSPCKVIITGEHAVVHGAPALAITIELFNTVRITETNGPLGFEVRQKNNLITLDENGDPTSGEIEWPIFCELLKKILENGIKPTKRLIITIESNVPKGVGASSSVAAALTLAMYKYANKPISKQLLFDYVQFVDKTAHGGNPSGIDAMSVISGPTKLIRTVEKNKPKWNFYPQTVELPKDCSLVIIDTSRGGPRSGTGEMVSKFATSMGLMVDGRIKQLTELTKKDKEKLIPFEEVYEEIVSELNANGDAVKLGKAMDANQDLLAKHYMSSPEIEEARKLAKKNGALGAKLTGAGGKGGAVIALIKNQDSTAVLNSLTKAGFNCFNAKQTRGLMQ